MRRVNPDTLEIETVNKREQPAIPYVYVLSDKGHWDYEETNTIGIYAKFNDALKAYKQRVKNAKEDLREWCDECDLVEEDEVNRDEERASFSAYQDDEYDKLHCEIYIEKQEVM